MLDMKTIVDERYLVSTVELPKVELKRFSHIKVPTFETMVFKCRPNGDVKSWRDLEVAHYYSKEEAQKGHRMMVRKVRNYGK